MKNLLTILLVLAMASAASAVVVFEVDPEDAKDSYMPSDIITINVVADHGVGSVGIGAIVTDKGGTATVIGLNPLLSQAPLQQGTPINDGTTLIEYIAGNVPLVAPELPAGAVLYSFEFHVPQVPDSTIITIDDLTDYMASPPKYTSINSKDYMNMSSDIGALQIHVPEPMTIALLGLGGLFLRRRR